MDYGGAIQEVMKPKEATAYFWADPIFLLRHDEWLLLLTFCDLGKNSDNRIRNRILNLFWHKEIRELGQPNSISRAWYKKCIFILFKNWTNRQLCVLLSYFSGISLTSCGCMMWEPIQKKKNLRKRPSLWHAWLPPPTLFLASPQRLQNLI